MPASASAATPPQAEPAAALKSALKAERQENTETSRRVKQAEALVQQLTDVSDRLAVAADRLAESVQRLEQLLTVDLAGAVSGAIREIRSELELLRQAGREGEP